MLHSPLLIHTLHTSLTFDSLSTHPSPQMQAKVKSGHGEYYESEALCSRARGTAYYAIAVGIGLGLFFALVLGLGPMFNWY